MKRSSLRDGFKGMKCMKPCQKHSFYSRWEYKEN